MKNKALLFGFLFLFALAGCGSSSSDAQPGNAPKEKPPAPPNGHPSEKDSGGESRPEDLSQGGDYLGFDGGLKVYPKAKRVELPAVLLGGQTRPLEFLLVQSGGALHESLFAAGARGIDLKRGLEIIGLKPGTGAHRGRGYLETPTGDAVRISVRFTHAGTGEETTVPVEDWLWDSLLQATPEKVGFAFTGGHETFEADLNRDSLSADQVGNLIAMWHDGSCLLDNAREHGVISDCYTPNPNASGMPAAGADVLLIFERQE